MKKQLLLLALPLLFLTLNGLAQDSIPNGGFENWTSATYNYPDNFGNNSNPQTFFQAHDAFNCTINNVAYHGTQALQLTTDFNGVDTTAGYITNAITTNGNPSTWTGGIPYNQMATGLRGYYKYNVASGDAAIMIIIFKYQGTQIGMYFNAIGGVHATYTLFNFQFMPALTQTPDSVIIAFASSNKIQNIQMAGSTLVLDSISFTGVTSQPALLNGDFENWQTTSINTPDNWYFNNNGGGSQLGFNRTTDASVGIYAMELTTLAGSNNSGAPRSQPGSISNGYWDQNCNCEKGGYPFSNQIDTLVFDYKYIPSDPSDSAQVMMNMKYQGSNIWGTQASIHASATYQTMEIPFNIFSAVDTAIVGFNSTSWADSTVNFIGADLKIDNVHFKGNPMPTNISLKNTTTDVSFYPNPMKNSGTLEIGAQVNLSGAQLRIYDMLGRTINTMEVTKHSISIDRNNIINGMYFYEFTNDNKIIKTGKIVVE